MDTVMVPWMVELGLVSWRTVKFGGRPPLPSEIVASFIIFGSFSLIPNRRIGSALGWGIVVASALNLLPAIVSGPKTQGNKNPFGINPDTSKGSSGIVQGTPPNQGQSGPNGGLIDGNTGRLVPSQPAPNPSNSLIPKSLFGGP